MRLGGYFFTFGAVSYPSDCRDCTDFFNNELHGLYGFFVARSDDGRIRTIRMAGAAEALKSV